MISTFVHGASSRQTILPIAISFFTAVSVIAAEFVMPPSKVEFPAAKSAADSLACIKVDSDLVVELVAAEPAVCDPIDIAWGADGSMWVVEMADYPMGMDGKGKPGGRIRHLSSSKRDGVFDRSDIFVDGLRFPTAVLPWKKGILVSAIPDIIYLEDVDGDGRADKREVVFTGLTEGNPQHLANALQWGGDGWVYLANGNSGGRIKFAGSAEVVDLGLSDFRVQPETGKIELVTGHSQFGRNRDDWNNWFGCTNSNPFLHYALDAEYLRRNPRFVPPDPIVTIAAIPGAAPVYPISKPMARFNDPKMENHFTSACSVMVYRDELLGGEYQENLFVCEPVHNIVHREVRTAEGVTFKSRRVEREAHSEFLASTDSWSRFTSTRAGPDGALYVIDMYRMVIEHPKWIPLEWQKQLGNLRAGDNKGRIYRVRRKDVPLRAIPDLTSATSAQLLESLQSPSGIRRDLAQQQLLWRGDTSVCSELSRIASEAANPAVRLQALWTLNLLGGTSPAILSKLLGDPHPGVRRQAIKISEPLLDQDAGLLARVVDLAKDPDAIVRQQVAYSLGQVEGSEAANALVQLLRDDRDPFIRAAVFSSASRHAKTLIPALLADDDGIESALLLAADTDNLPLEPVIHAALDHVRSNSELQRIKVVTAALQALGRRQGSEVTDGDTRRLIEEILIAARGICSDDKQPVVDRAAALSALGRLHKDKDRDTEVAATLIDSRYAVELQTAAIDAIARAGSEGGAALMLQNWGSLGGRVRNSILDAILQRLSWSQFFLDWVAKDPALSRQIDPMRRSAFLHHNDQSLAQRAEQLLGAGVSSDRDQLIKRYLAEMQPKTGNASAGRVVFQSICAACHRFGSVPGQSIGPDLATVTDRSRNYLVTHILDPNRAIEDRFRFFSARTVKGTEYAGMITEESASTVTILGLDGRSQVIPRDQLAALTTGGRSLMPDGLEAAISPNDMADLVAFLAGAVEPVSK